MGRGILFGSFLPLHLLPSMWNSRFSSPLIRTYCSVGTILNKKLMVFWFIFLSFISVLSPPMSPPLSHRINVSTDSEELPKLDPLACDINYFDTFLEHKPLPTPSKSSKIGTSSLGRKSKWRENSNGEGSPVSGGLTSPPTSSPNCASCRSPSQFPKVKKNHEFLKGVFF